MQLKVTSMDCFGTITAREMLVRHKDYEMEETKY